MALDQSIEVENLVKSYKGGIQVLGRFSFDASKGGTFDLVAQMMQENPQ